MKLFNEMVITALICAALGWVTADVIHYFEPTVQAKQDYIYNTFQFGYKDYPLPPGPCAPGQQTSATPVAFDTSMWVMYTCFGSDQPIFRRFFGGVTPPVGRTPAQVEDYICPNGFVQAKAGGCVPPDHPDAQK